MRARSGPTVEHRVLAVRLRMLRERAGISLRSAAEALDAHPATVRRIERAETGLDARQVGELLRCYGVPPAVAEPIMAGLGAANLPGWWHRWRDAMEGWQQDVIGVESSASLVRSWHPALVPELLRTPAYAAALYRTQYPEDSPARRERRVELLRERRRRMCERGPPCGPCSRRRPSIRGSVTGRPWTGSGPRSPRRCASSTSPSRWCPWTTRRTP